VSHQRSRRDGIRLAVGTLSVFPVPTPRTVDQGAGSWAMVFAPLVGALLASAASLLLWLLGWAVFGLPPIAYDAVSVRPAPPALSAALVIGLLALLTRAIHLDGLADTADGLGSGKPAAEALAVMRKSDIGPFGVVALVMTLLVQVVSLTHHVGSGRGALAITVALVVSRLVLPFVCARGVPAARREGLGRAVAGSVSPAQLLLAALISAAVLGPALSATVDASEVAAQTVLRTVIVVVAALSAGATMCLWCVRRLGGVTGDVMGACVEVTFTVALVVPTML